jgi:hypothetical protein
MEDLAINKYSTTLDISTSQTKPPCITMNGPRLQISQPPSRNCLVSSSRTVSGDFPHLRFSKGAIDYYLSFLVFPKAMREFPEKLSVSSWDIGAIKDKPLTGFSDTNDTLHLLPLSHTNALVLEYPLRKENAVEVLSPHTSGTDTEHILSTILRMDPEIRVLLDCGTIILEQSNRQVAERWLNMRDGTVQAVVYFENEELTVLDRVGRAEPLHTSPFAKQLGTCLVYPDEAHTRGTDLELQSRSNLGSGFDERQAYAGFELTKKCTYYTLQI